MAAVFRAGLTGKSLFSFVYNPGASYRRVRYGTFGNFLYFTGLLDTETVRTFHWNINCWSDSEVMAWKDAYVSNCTTVAVAAAVFASVGLSALQLPKLDETHWTARAFLSSSMLLGVLSVSSATILQQKVTRLTKAWDVRLWLSRGFLPQLKLEPDHVLLRSRLPTDAYQEPYCDLPLESSAATLKLSEIPKRLLNLSVLLYIVGFGVYQLYFWLHAVESPSNDNRNIFLVYVIVLGVAVAYITWLNAIRLLDAQKRSDDCDLAYYAAYSKKSVSQKRLEEWLQLIADLHKEKFDDEESYDTLKSIRKRLQQRWLRQSPESGVLFQSVPLPIPNHQAEELKGQGKKRGKAPAADLSEPARTEA